VQPEERRRTQQRPPHFGFMGRFILGLSLDLCDQGTKGAGLRTCRALALAHRGQGCTNRNEERTPALAVLADRILALVDAGVEAELALGSGTGTRCSDFPLETRGRRTDRQSRDAVEGACGLQGRDDAPRARQHVGCRSGRGKDSERCAEQEHDSNGSSRHLDAALRGRLRQGHCPRECFGEIANLRRLFRVMDHVSSHVGSGSTERRPLVRHRRGAGTRGAIVRQNCAATRPAYNLLTTVFIEWSSRCPRCASLGAPNKAGHPGCGRGISRNPSLGIGAPVRHWME